MLSLFLAFPFASALAFFFASRSALISSGDLESDVGTDSPLFADGISFVFSFDSFFASSADSVTGCGSAFLLSDFSTTTFSPSDIFTNALATNSSFIAFSVFSSCSSLSFAGFSTIVRFSNFSATSVTLGMAGNSIVLGN